MTGIRTTQLQHCTCALDPSLRGPWQTIAADLPARLVQGSSKSSHAIIYHQPFQQDGDWDLLKAERKWNTIEPIPSDPGPIQDQDFGAILERESLFIFSIILSTSAWPVSACFRPHQQSGDTIVPEPVRPELRAEALPSPSPEWLPSIACSIVSSFF